MSASFISIAFIAAVLIVNWRLLLLLSASVLVALVIFGMGVVQPEQSPGQGPGQVAPNGASSAVVGQPGPR